MAVVNKRPIAASTEPEQMNQNPNKFQITLFRFFLMQMEKITGICGRFFSVGKILVFYCLCDLFGLQEYCLREDSIKYCLDIS